jgi:folate-binding protein YgfZ
MTPQHSTTPYDVARHGAGVIDRSDLGRLVISGRDRGSYLNGLLTNDTASLRAGEGCYSAYLTPQGRMIADMWVYELGDVMLMTLGRDVKDVVLAKLDQFIFSEDVQLGDVTNTFAHVAVVGPLAARTVAAVLGLDAGALRSLPEHGNVRATFAGGSAIVLAVGDLGEAGLGVLVDANQSSALTDALRRAGAESVDAATADVLRVEAGLPRFHRDLDEDTIPLEAGLETRAISMTKGCYVGQEVIVRVLHRGHGRVARRLVGLTLAGDRVPAAGARVHAGDREIGRVTSAVRSVALMTPIALAYLHRDFTEPGHRVAVGGDEAVVTTLPFVLPRSG